MLRTIYVAVCVILPSAKLHKHKAVCAFTANVQQFMRRLTTEAYIQIQKHIIEGQH